MPCTNDGFPEDRDEIQKLTRMLCLALRYIEQEKLKIPIPPKKVPEGIEDKGVIELSQWWSSHKADDERRIKEFRKQQEKEKSKDREMFEALKKKHDWK